MTTVLFYSVIELLGVEVSGLLRGCLVVVMERTRRV